MLRCWFRTHRLLDFIYQPHSCVLFPAPTSRLLAASCYLFMPCHGWQEGFSASSVPHTVFKTLFFAFRLYPCFY
ncbi:hypothetical protein E2C01_095979 [Portunus trituberculatus]|uniref:Uncharacterized protein n=1 Tax=Portunus trituberculatus TaxID=210409 RepID=A0A5B7K1K5_PORTR|nr:hypothetical protein [Portunus trituberculatus]